MKNKHIQPCDLKKVTKKLMMHYGFRPDPTEFLAVKASREGMHPFGVLVSIILTQNTSDKNAMRALENLVRRLGPKLSPEAFKQVSIDELAQLIKPSGMHTIKATTIYNVLNRLQDPDLLASEDPVKLRELLLSIKGIGPKTADVFLLAYRGFPTFPIDTHIRRVLFRLGHVKKKESYESIRAKVMSSLSRDMLLPAHILLITHGRRICKARKPLCESCPIKEECLRIGVEIEQNNEC